MKKTYNVGFIGFGFIGKVHAYGYLNLPLFTKPMPLQPKITHICTSRPETAEEGRALLNAEHAVTDFRQITENPDIDIVHICTPNNNHKEALLSAMKHQKHIYCDKPLVSTIAEAEEIRAALKDYRGTAQMTLQCRFFPATMRAKQLMNEGFVGQVLEFRAAYLHAGSADPNAPLKWKLSAAHGGGVIADLASHAMDLTHHLVGDFDSLQATTHIAYLDRPSADDPTKRVRVDAEDCVMMLVKTKSGAIGTIEATKIATGAEDEMRIEIHGSKGALRFNGMDAHHLEAYDARAADKPIGGVRGWTRIDTGQRYPAPEGGFPGPKFGIGWLRGHAACLNNFLQCVAAGNPASPGLDHGIYIQNLMDCAQRSARDRRWVEVRMILAIDFGSTTIKAGMFDRKLRQLTEGNAPLKYRFGAGGKVEMPVQSVEEAVRQAIRLAKPKGAAVIAVTSQAQTHTVLNAKGRAIRPFVSWQDARADAACSVLKRSLKNFGEHCSFAEILSALQVCQLKHNPVGPHAAVLHLPTYFVQQWTGENIIDDNIAAMSGLYSLKLGGWWPTALQACKLRAEQLSRVVPIGSIAANTTSAAIRYGLPVNVPIVLAGNDQTSGAYATRLETGNGLLLTLGSAQVVYACLTKLPAARAGLIRGPYPGRLGYRMTADNAGGNIVNWAETILSGCETHEKFYSNASRAQTDSHGLKFELSPQGDRASWQNAGLHHTPADFARAILERLSGRMAEMVGRLDIRLAGRKVLVAGGGSQSLLWTGLIGQKLGVKLHPTEARPALGAARMALPYLK